jgi:hypothetical protein
VEDSSERCPIPTCWQQEIVEDLQDALEQFTAIATALGVPGGAPKGKR